MGWRVGSLVAALCSLPAAATAQWRPGLAKEAPIERVASPPSPQRFWYGQPILLADGLSYGLILLTTEYDQVAPQTMPLAVANYLLTPSLIHLSVGNWAQAVVDVPLRLGLPFGGALLGAASSCQSGDCASATAGGAIAGMLAATIIDVAFLAYEKPKRGPQSVLPAFSIGSRHGLVGAAGAF